MSYGEMGALVVFLDAEKADANYPSGGSLRLLLHGSRRQSHAETGASIVPSAEVGASW